MEKTQTRKIAPDIKKIYNRTYYTKHKDELMGKMLLKVECCICKKLVTSCNLKRHHKSLKCKSLQMNHDSTNNHHCDNDDNDTNDDTTTNNDNDSDEE